MRHSFLRRAAFPLATAFALAACGSSGGGGSSDSPAAGLDAGDAPATDGGAGADSAATAPLTKTITQDFQGWLNTNGYAGDDFVRAGTGGSFGGRAASGDAIAATPVVFIHGNSDSAIGLLPQLTGWDAARRSFLARGFDANALYGMTWGPADFQRRLDQTHNRAYLTRIRRFLQAVHDYTGASKVHVVAHSMGTTLARKAIEGGAGTDEMGSYALGAPLTSLVDTFVGIAGGNRGLTSCYMSGALTCSNVFGFGPGANAMEGPSQVLSAMNATPHDEGAHVFSLCSTADDVIGYGGIVWGQATCAIPGADQDVAANALKHVELKDLTGETLVRLVTTHTP